MGVIMDISERLNRAIDYIEENSTAISNGYVFKNYSYELWFPIGKE